MPLTQSLPSSNTIYGNSELVSNSSKYNLLNVISFGVDNTKVINYNELINRYHAVNCVGTNPNSTTVYKLYLPNIGVQYTRLLRQYYQLQQVPIGFVGTSIDIRLIGNAQLEVYVENNIIATYTNPFYQLNICHPIPGDLRQDYSLYLLFGESDAIEWSNSPYYNEPLVVPNTHC